VYQLSILCLYKICVAAYINTDKFIPDIFCVTASGQAVGGIIRFATELNDAPGCAIGVFHLQFGVLKKLARHVRGMDTVGHEIATLVTQYSDDLGRERFVQQLKHDLAVRGVVSSNAASHNVLTRALTQGQHVGRGECSFDTFFAEDGRMCCFFPLLSGLANCSARPIATAIAVTVYFFIKIFINNSAWQRT